MIYFKNKENFAMKFPADWEEWTLFSSWKKKKGAGRKRRCNRTSIFSNIDLQ
jgi:hypothetical protein